MRKEFILAIVATSISLTSVTVFTDAFAQLEFAQPEGSLSICGNEHVIHYGTTISCKISINMDYYKQYPKLEIFHQDELIQKIQINQIKDNFHEMYLGFDQNWNKGDYQIRLVSDGRILDSKDFQIIKEFDLKYEKPDPIFKEIDYTRNFELNKDSFKVDYSTVDYLIIKGHIPSKDSGHFLKINYFLEDEQIFSDRIKLTSSDDFKLVKNINRFVPSGIYTIYAHYNNENFEIGQVEIKNNWLIENKDETENLYELEITGKKVSNLNVLEISSKDFISQNEMNLIVKKDGNIVFEEPVTATDENIASVILFDNLKKTQWEDGEYEIQINSGTKKQTKTNFSIKDNTVLGTKIDKKMQIQLEEGQSNSFTVEHLEEIPITVSGKLDRTPSNFFLKVISTKDVIHTLRPILTENLEYSVIMKIDENFESGRYQILEFDGQTPLQNITFDVNNLHTSTDVIESDETVIVNSFTPSEKKLSLDSFRSNSVTNFKFNSEVSGKIPVIVTTPTNSTHTSLVRTASNGDVDYYVNVNSEWMSGEYMIKSNDQIVGKLFVENPYLQTPSLKNNPVMESPKSNSFRFSPQTITFEGVANEILNRKITITLGDSSSTVFADSDGRFTGKINIFSLEPGIHKISASSMNQEISYDHVFVPKSAFFRVSNDQSLEIQSSEFFESGGQVSVIAGGKIPSFDQRYPQPVTFSLDSGSEITKVTDSGMGLGNYLRTMHVSNEYDNITLIVRYGEKTISENKIVIIPSEQSWLKDKVSLWLEGNLSDYLLIKVILNEYGISFDDSSAELPGWIVDSARHYVSDQIEFSDFAEIVKFEVMQ